MPTKKRTREVASERANGPRPGPAFARREKWVRLGELDAAHEGFEVRIWTNFPSGFVAGLSPTDPSAFERLGQIVLEHNGWVGFDGQVLPSPTDAAFWSSLPYDTAALMGRAILQEASATPNFQKPTSGS